jgi:hypothetical protein
LFVLFYLQRWVDAHSTDGTTVFSYNCDIVDGRNVKWIACRHAASWAGSPTAPSNAFSRTAGVLERIWRRRVDYHVEWLCVRMRRYFFSEDEFQHIQRTEASFEGVSELWQDDVFAPGIFSARQIEMIDSGEERFQSGRGTPTRRRLHRTGNLDESGFAVFYGAADGRSVVLLHS